jgi:phosphoribosyl 1,2-cyclic phosphodiesterase
LAEAGDFRVRFWGVRGSVATPGPSYVRYGGNTSCVEMRCGDHLLIFDGGTGMRPLGQALRAECPIDADIFYSHTHLDHVNGIPFFVPLYDAHNAFRFWSGHLLPKYDLNEVLNHMMTPPLFPVPFEIFSARIEFKDFEAGLTLDPRPGVRIRTIGLNHPNGATGYRVEYAGRSACYVTDIEHTEDGPDDAFLDFLGGADLLIYDSTYTDAEYPAYAGWGHSTWQEGVRLSERAGVGQFVIFHHDPTHDDDFMDGIAAEAEAMRPGTVVAREGMVLTP